MNIESIVQSVTVTSSLTLSLPKYFFWVIWDDLYISDYKMNLSEFFRNFQNARHVEFQVSILT